MTAFFFFLLHADTRHFSFYTTPSTALSTTLSTVLTQRTSARPGLLRGFRRFHLPPQISRAEFHPRHQSHHEKRRLTFPSRRQRLSSVPVTLKAAVNYPPWLLVLPTRLRRPMSYLMSVELVLYWIIVLVVLYTDGFPRKTILVLDHGIIILLQSSPSCVLLL